MAAIDRWKTWSVPYFSLFLRQRLSKERFSNLLLCQRLGGRRSALFHRGRQRGGKSEYLYRVTLQRSLASSRSNSKSTETHPWSFRICSSNSTGPGLRATSIRPLSRTVISISSPSFRDRASTTDAGRRMARLFPPLRYLHRTPWTHKLIFIP